MDYISIFFLGGEEEIKIPGQDNHILRGFTFTLKVSIN